MRLQNSFRFLLLVTVLLLSSESRGQAGISREAYKAVSGVRESVVLFNGKLRLVNVFRQQVQWLYRTRYQSAAKKTRSLLRHTYRPYRALWEGYVGGEARYGELMTELRDSLSERINAQALLFSQSGMDTVFERLALEIKSLTGREPEGTWYIAFGHGVTDMGGLGNGIMVLDLLRETVTPAYVRRILPHEFNHQVFDRSNPTDTTARGLYRCINEGLAVYVNQLFYGNRFTLADYLGYSPEQLKIAYDKEEKLRPLLQKKCFTSDESDARDLADRGSRITPAGPGAIGYFVGYRIVEAYVKSHGRDSWKELYDKPVRVILAESGYTL